jgi:predicted dehydrogenase
MSLRVGIAGLAHDHVWSQLKEWDEVPSAKVIAVGEPNQALHPRAAAGRSGIRFFNCWREMYANTELDIVVVTTDNREARAVVEEAARKNIAVLLEKPLAADLEDGEAIYAVARSANIPFFVNWFTLWVPEIASVLLLAKRGDIGRIHSLRFRIAHAGPKEIGCTPEFIAWLYDPVRNGGGALVDFCSYGACMASFVLGDPTHVTGVAGNWVKEDLGVEDNGILLLHYSRGVAICEGSWTQQSATQLDGPQIHGDKGTLSVVDGHIHLLNTLDGSYRVLPPEPASKAYRSGPAFFTHHVSNDLRIDGIYDPVHALVAQRCLSAGLRAANEGRRVPI